MKKRIVLSMLMVLVMAAVCFAQPEKDYVPNYYPAQPEADYVPNYSPALSEANYMPNYDSAKLEEKYVPNYALVQPEADEQINSFNNSLAEYVRNFRD